MRKAAKERGADLDRFPGVEPEEARAERVQSWEEVFSDWHSRRELTMAQLPALKSHRDKALHAAVMKATSCVSNSWLSQRLDMGDPHPPVSLRRRFMLTPEGRAQVEGCSQESRPDVFCSALRPARQHHHPWLAR